ncbi:MAG TPA: hypothetical protein ACFYD6_11305 [Candidatus Brocadiia bacterium]|nr:hypothetical protein [Candidatus Brocadiales bacterium]
MAKTRRIDVKKAVLIHGVYDEDVTQLYDIHSHGLNKYGHSEFRILCESLFVPDAVRIIDEIADYLLNQCEGTIKAGDTITLNGREVRFSPGTDHESDSEMLLVEGIPGAYTCGWESARLPKKDKKGNRRFLCLAESRIGRVYRDENFIYLQYGRTTTSLLPQEFAIYRNMLNKVPIKDKSLLEGKLTKRRKKN